MYGNTQMAILPLLPMLCICENLDNATRELLTCHILPTDLYST